MKSIKNKLLTLSLGLSVFAVSSSAIDLEEAIYIALHKNLDLASKYAQHRETKQNIKLNEANYRPKLDLSYGYNNRSRVNSGAEEDSTVSATLSYNLFNGLKDISNKQSSEFLSKSSKYSLKALQSDIALDTKRAYINVLDKQNALETYQSEYELFNKQYTDASNRYEQGLMARNDLLQVQVNMSNAKQNVVRSKADIKIAKIQLSNIIGGFDLTNEKIEPLKENRVRDTNFDKEVIENRSEIKALKMTIESLRKQQKAAKGSYLPTVDASVSHNRFYDDLSFGQVDSGIDSQNVATLSATWNLYSGGKDQTQVAIYNSRMADIKAQLVKTQLDIKLQYENAKSDLEVANDNLKTATLALEQAKENYNIVRNRFNEGISTSTDLTDANFLLTSAKQRFSKAYFDKYLSIASLNRVFEIL